MNQKQHALTPMAPLTIAVAPPARRARAVRARPTSTAEATHHPPPVARDVPSSTPGADVGAIYRNEHIWTDSLVRAMRAEDRCEVLDAQRVRERLGAAGATGVDVEGFGPDSMPGIAP